MNEMQQHPHMTFVLSSGFAGPTVETALAGSLDTLSALVHPRLTIDGVFTPNESSTVGMRRALRDLGVLHKVRFVGFDSNPELIDALRSREIDGLVVQDPLRMGYVGVLSVVKAIRGAPLPRFTDTGAVLATPENMSQPGVEELLSPQVDRYLSRESALPRNLAPDLIAEGDSQT